MTSRIRSRDVWVLLGNALALAGLVWLVWQLRTLVTWLLVAIVIALAAEPLIQVLVRRGVRRGWAVLIACTCIGVVVIGIVATIVPMVIEQSRDLIARAPQLLERLRDSAPARWLDERVDLVEWLRGAAEGRARQVAQPALAAAITIVGSVVALVTIVILAVLAMLVGGGVVRGGLAWLPPATRARWERLGERMKTVVGKFVLGEAIIALIAGLVMGVTTALLGVPYFLALAIVMVFLTLIPYIGGMIGAVLVVGVTFTSEGLVPGLIALGVYLGYQQLENQVLQTIVQRRTMRINALLVALALLAGTMLAGIAGALLALPVVGTLQVILDDVRARRATRWGEAAESGADAESGTRDEDRAAGDEQHTPSESAHAT